LCLAYFIIFIMTIVFDGFDYSISTLIRYIIQYKSTLIVFLLNSFSAFEIKM